MTVSATALESSEVTKTKIMSQEMLYASLNAVMDQFEVCILKSHL